MSEDSSKTLKREPSVELHSIGIPAKKSKLDDEDAIKENRPELVNTSSNAEDTINLVLSDSPAPSEDSEDVNRGFS